MLNEFWIKYIWIKYELIIHYWEEELSEAEKWFTLCKKEPEEQTEKVKPGVKKKKKNIQYAINTTVFKIFSKDVWHFLKLKCPKVMLRSSKAEQLQIRSISQ